MIQVRTTYGYFHIRLGPEGPCRWLHTNGERAFIVSQLQQALSPRLALSGSLHHQHLAAGIDLLAFSIQADAIQLVLFSIDRSLCMRLAQLLRAKLDIFLDEHSPMQVHPQQKIYIQKLRGSHHALATTATLHMIHTDWEYDRYSSIGFYLHDRRGDWMRLWRMTRLYENNAELYRDYLLSSATAQAHGQQLRG